MASIFGTAVGTTLLALATGALAYLTWGDVRATQALANQGQAEQEARERPIVVMHSRMFNGSWDAGHLHVELVNVGLGPALRVLVKARYDDPNYPAHQQPQQPRIDPFLLPALASSGRASLVLNVTFPRPVDNPGVQNEYFTLSGGCRDVQERRHEVLAQWNAGPQYGPVPD